MKHTYTLSMLYSTNRKRVNKYRIRSGFARSYAATELFSYVRELSRLVAVRNARMWMCVCVCWMHWARRVFCWARCSYKIEAYTHSGRTNKALPKTVSQIKWTRAQKAHRIAKPNRQQQQHQQINSLHSNKHDVWDFSVGDGKASYKYNPSTALTIRSHKRTHSRPSFKFSYLSRVQLFLLCACIIICCVRFS